MAWENWDSIGTTEEGMKCEVEMGVSREDCHQDCEGGVGLEDTVDTLKKKAFQRKITTSREAMSGKGTR